MWHARLKTDVPPKAGRRAEASRLVARREPSRTSTHCPDRSARSATPPESLPRNGAARGTAKGCLGRTATADRAEHGAPSTTSPESSPRNGAPGGASQALSHGGRVGADPAAQRSCDQACGTKSRSHDVVLPFW